MDNKEIVEVKRELIMRYFLLMFFILLLYLIAFYYEVEDLSKLYILLLGSVSYIVLYFFVQRNKYYNLNILIHLYFALAPLYNLYFLISYFNITPGHIVWILPIPLGAYILLGKKYAIYYSAYSFIMVIVGGIISHNSPTVKPNMHYQIFFYCIEISAFLVNALIILYLIYYKDKIKQYFLISTEKTVKAKKEILLNKQEHIDFFYRLDSEVKSQKYFTDSNFTISKLCIILNTNSSYISRAIRTQNYTNFTTYLNTLRILYVKKLIEENDLSKVTLMYIYTEAGFSNQSTFNRVFKQIENVTPRDYIKNRNLPHSNEKLQSSKEIFPI